MATATNYQHGMGENFIAHAQVQLMLIEQMKDKLKKSSHEIRKLKLKVKQYEHLIDKRKLPSHHSEEGEGDEEEEEEEEEEGEEEEKEDAEGEEKESDTKQPLPKRKRKRHRQQHSVDGNSAASSQSDRDDDGANVEPYRKVSKKSKKASIKIVNHHSKNNHFDGGYGCDGDVLLDRKPKKPKMSNADARRLYKAAGIAFHCGDELKELVGDDCTKFLWTHKNYHKQFVMGEDTFPMCDSELNSATYTTAEAAAAAAVAAASGSKKTVVALPEWSFDPDFAQKVKDSRPEDVPEEERLRGEKDRANCEKAHDKREEAEKKQKRWDFQRVREEKYLDKLKKKDYEKMANSQGLTSFHPSLYTAQEVVVSKYIPIDIFGHPMPRWDSCVEYSPNDDTE